MSIWDAAAVAEDAVETAVDHDFDADWQARGMGARVVRILGKLYELPPEPPAKLILMKSRLAAQPGREVGAAEMVDLLGTIIGRGQVDDLLDRGIGARKLLDVARYCMTAMAEESQGEAQAPAQGAQTAGAGSA